MYANKITIPSDGNELTLVEVINAKGKEDKIIRYKYTKGKEKKGMVLDLREKDYEHLLKNKIGINMQTI